MTEKLSERQLVEIWQNQSLAKSSLLTEDGEPIEIVYPGRINDDRGGDFRDAVIATGHGLVKGDVELHLKSIGWYQHRHHLNSDYNRVILHVVMWHDGNTITSLANGNSIPILALEKYLSHPSGQRSISAATCGHNGGCPSEPVIDFLDRAGEERFQGKASRYRYYLSIMEPEQVLYQGIMEVLGYSKNKLYFQALAQRLPLQKLWKISREINTEKECLSHLQGLLLGSAGLLPSQRGDNNLRNLPGEEWVGELEDIWRDFYAHQAGKVTFCHDWHLFKVRPGNSPIRRLAAMAHLVLRYRRQGMLETMLDIIEELPAAKSRQQLEQALLVRTDGYWADHYDFGLFRRAGSPTLLGPERAGIIVVNVLLPFAFARGQFIARKPLIKNALDIFQHYPGLSQNAVNRHMMRQAGLASGIVNSARRQQGLLHIYENLCSQGRCCACCFKQSQT